MDFAKITAEYYSKWIGKDNILLDMGSGVEYIFSPERNVVQLGYSRQFDLFILRQPDKLIISYGDKLKNDSTEKTCSLKTKYTRLECKSLPKIVENT